jgi:hypothetical protein
MPSSHRMLCQAPAGAAQRAAVEPDGWAAWDETRSGAEWNL